MGKIDHYARSEPSFADLIKEKLVSRDGLVPNLRNYNITLEMKGLRSDSGSGGFCWQIVGNFLYWDHRRFTAIGHLEENCVDDSKPKISLLTEKAGYLAGRLEGELPGLSVEVRLKDTNHCELRLDQKELSPETDKIYKNERPISNERAKMLFAQMKAAIQ